MHSQSSSFAETVGFLTAAAPWTLSPNNNTTNTLDNNRNIANPPTVSSHHIHKIRFNRSKKLGFWNDDRVQRTICMAKLTTTRIVRGGKKGGGGGPAGGGPAGPTIGTTTGAARMTTAITAVATTTTVAPLKSKKKVLKKKSSAVLGPSSSLAVGGPGGGSSGSGSCGNGGAVQDKKKIKRKNGPGAKAAAAVLGATGTSAGNGTAVLQAAATTSMKKVLNKNKATSTAAAALTESNASRAAIVNNAVETSFASANTSQVSLVMAEAKKNKLLLSKKSKQNQALVVAKVKAALVANRERRANVNRAAVVAKAAVIGSRTTPAITTTTTVSNRNSSLVTGLTRSIFPHKEATITSTSAFELSTKSVFTQTGTATTVASPSDNSLTSIVNPLAQVSASSLHTTTMTNLNPSPTNSATTKTKTTSTTSSTVVKPKTNKSSSSSSSSDDRSGGSIDALHTYLSEVRALHAKLTTQDYLALNYDIKRLAAFEKHFNRFKLQHKRPPTHEEWAAQAQMDIAEFKTALSKGERAKERIIQANLKLVVSIAQKNMNKGMSLQDMIQEGSIGLIRGAQKFDPEKGYKFSTYVTFWIQAAIARAIASFSRPIRLPGYVIDTYSAVKKTAKDLTVELGRAPSEHEIARRMKTDVEKLHELKLNTRQTISLETPCGFASSHNEGYTTLGHIIECHRDTPEQELTQQIRRDYIASVLKNKLDETEYEIIMLRFGFDDREPMTLRDIGLLKGVSKETIRKKEVKALAKLRDPVVREILEEHVHAN